jgi:hypothetical protein
MMYPDNTPPKPLHFKNACTILFPREALLERPYPAASVPPEAGLPRDDAPSMMPLRSAGEGLHRHFPHLPVHDRFTPLEKTGDS